MPNIPDKLYKLFVLIGLFLVGFSWLKSNDSYKEYSVKYERYDAFYDSLKLLNEEIFFEEEKFVSECSEVESKHNLDSICYVDGDSIVFSKPISVEPEVKSDILLLERIWSKIIDLKHKENLLNVKLENLASDHDEAKRDLVYRQDEYGEMQVLGFALIGIGIGMWLFDENDRLKEKTKQFDKIYNTCQSCGNKFTSLRSYGKNQDGTFNLGLCYECYENGDFLESDLTKIVAFNRYCKKHHITKKMSKNRIKRFFDKLERWEY